MQAELLRRGRENDSGLRHDQRLVGVIADPRTFERIAPLDDPAAQIAGLARRAAQFLEPLEIGFELIIADAPILNREIGGKRSRYFSSSRIPGSAKSAFGVRLAPRSRPTTVSPALVSSRAMMLPVQPMPTSTASTCFSFLAMARP